MRLNLGRGAKIILVIAVVMIIIAAGAVVLSQPQEQKIIVMKSGDKLYYSLDVNDSSSHRTISGEVEFFNGIMTSSIRGSTGLDHSSGVGQMEPTIDHAGYSGQVIGSGRISTVFGEKCVTNYAELNDKYVVIREVGQQSGVVYRKIVYMEGYQMTIDLKGTNNREVWTADGKYSEVQLGPVGHVKDDGTTFIIAEQETMIMMGVVSIGSGEKVHYDVVGDNISVSFFDASGFGKMLSQSDMTPIPQLSTPWGRNGTVSMATAPGNYLYIVLAISPMNESFFKPYWY